MWLYLFWHSPAPSVARTAYETALGRFQERLAATARREGLALVAETARAPGLPWRPDAAAGDTYEDGYWVESLAALERLDHLAVAGAMRAVHDGAAALARAGQGGLYRSLSGPAPEPGAVWSTWLAKPGGAAYGEFEPALGARARAAGGIALRRTMVLSPAPEYLVRSPRPVALDWPAVAVCRRAPLPVVG